MRITHYAAAVVCTASLIVLGESMRGTLTPLSNSSNSSNALAAGPCDSPANEIVAENCLVW